MHACLAHRYSVHPAGNETNPKVQFLPLSDGSICTPDRLPQVQIHVVAFILPHPQTILTVKPILCGEVVFRDKQVVKKAQVNSQALAA